MNANEWDRTHLWRFRAAPLRVIDGDTLAVLLDLGCYARYEAHIRIAGLDAPERYEPDGDDAISALGNALYLADLETPWPLRVVTQQRETVISEVKSFTRYVGDIFVALPDGTLVDLTELL